MNNDCGALDPAASCQTIGAGGGDGWGLGDTAVTLAGWMEVPAAAGDEVLSLAFCPMGTGQTRKNKLKI